MNCFRIFPKKSKRSQKDHKDTFAKKKLKHGQHSTKSHNNLEEHCCILSEKKYSQTDLFNKQENKHFSFKEEFQPLKEPEVPQPEESSALQQELEVLTGTENATGDDIADQEVKSDVVLHENKTDLNLNTQENKNVSFKEEFQPLKEQEVPLEEEYSTLQEELEVLTGTEDATEDKITEQEVKSDAVLHENKTDLNLNTQEKSTDFDGKLTKIIDNEYYFQEVQSLQYVIEMRQQEIRNLRLSLATTSEAVESLEVFKRKSSVLEARCEDLEYQLQQKMEVEKNLLIEKELLQASLKKESNRSKKLQLVNEELEWRIAQIRVFNNNC